MKCSAIILCVVSCLCLGRSLYGFECVEIYNNSDVPFEASVVGEYVALSALQIKAHTDNARPPVICFRHGIFDLIHHTQLPFEDGRYEVKLTLKFANGRQLSRTFTVRHEGAFGYHHQYRLTVKPDGSIDFSKI